MTQPPLFAELRLSAKEIRQELEAWPEQFAYRFWERVGIVDDGRFLDETVVKVFYEHREGRPR